MNFFPAQIISIRDATPKIKVFRLLHQRTDYQFKPGQWIDLMVPIEGKNIGGYTIISSEHTQEFVDIAVRESAHHPVTIYLHSAGIGTNVQITLGQGKFFLTNEVAASRSLIFIAGGIGITPILSMIRSVDKSRTKILLFYSVSHLEDILFEEELSPFTIFTITKEIIPSRENKRIELDLLKKYRADLQSDFFICGPRPMIDSVVNSLLSVDVSAEKIHYEKWW